MAGRRRGLWPEVQRAGLWLASLPYGWAVRSRNLLYEHGWRRTHRAPVPVVSIGNLTLGGTGNEKGKRHPTLGNHVVVGTGAKVLGNILIGHHVKIGAGSVVVRPAPDYSTVVGVPGHIVRTRNEEGELEHGKLPDPEGQAIEELARRVQELESQLRALMADRLEHEVSRKA